MTNELCPACGSANYERLDEIDVVKQHLLYAPNDPEMRRNLDAAAAQASMHYTMRRCTDCGLHYSSPMAAGTHDWYVAAYTAIELFPQDRWEFFFVSAAVRPQDIMFELGCGDGAFLLQCKKVGVAASGVDLSSAAIEVCRERGLSAYQADLGTPLPPEARVHATQVAAFHVMEHVSDPSLVFLRAAEAGSGRGTTLWVSIPSDLRFHRRYRIKDFLDEPPHHMTRWNPSSLREIGKRNGWRLVEHRYEPLTWREAIWLVTRNSAAYRSLTSKGVLTSRAIDKAFRALYAPVAFLRRLGSERTLTGHTQLARFEYEP